MAKKDSFRYEKVLRIGVAKQQSILGEHLLLPDNTFSIGVGGDVNFLVSGFSKHTLFQTKGGSYYLNFTSQMDGKLMASKSNTVLLHDLQNQNDVQSKGGVYSVRLSDSSKGKISVGEFTFIFQFIDAPPLAMQAHYIHKEKFLEDDDLLFLSLLSFNTICSIMLFFYATMIYEAPPEPEMTAEEIAKYLKVQMDMEESEIPDDSDAIEDENGEATEKESSDEKEEETEEAADDSEDVVVDKGNNDPNSKPSTEDINSAMNEISGLSASALLGTESAGAPVLSNMKAFNENSVEISISNTNTTSGGNAALAVVNSDKLEAGTDIKIKKTGGKKTVKVKKTKVNVRKKVKVQSGSMKSSGGKCKVEIKSVVRKKQGNINFCYDQAVANDPSLSGKIKIKVVIKKSGHKISFASGSLKSKKLENCIKRKVKKWTFPSNCEGVPFQKTYILKTE